MSSSAPTRWGLAGTGSISEDFANAFTAMDEGTKGLHKVVAVAARTQVRCMELIITYGLYVCRLSVCTDSVRSYFS